MSEDRIKAKHQRIASGVKAAIAEALERHRKWGESIAVWRDGQVVVLRAEQIPIAQEPSESAKRDEWLSHLCSNGLGGLAAEVKAKLALRMCLSDRLLGVSIEPSELSVGMAKLKGLPRKRAISKRYLLKQIASCSQWVFVVRGWVGSRKIARAFF